MRNAKDYASSLQDGRRVFILGEEVNDVSSHPVFAGAISTIGELYELSSAPDSNMVFTAPETGGLANKVHMIPRSLQDMQERRDAIWQWAGITKGFMGRSPDHVGAFIAGFASAAEMFNRNGREFAPNVLRFYKKLLEEDLFVSYVIIPPQVSRSTTAHGWEGELIQVGVAEERDDGIVLRGAQMLGTGAAISDFIFVSCIKPLQAEDEDQALSFVVPVGKTGVKLYCRRPYSVGQPSSFDYPLSTRFDESDALVVFDNVFIPWEDVFVYRDVEALRLQFFDTAAHSLGNHQAQVRLVRKLHFVLGVAKRTTEVNQTDGIPSVQETLGELASLAALVEAAVVASEAAGHEDKWGVYRPNARYLYGAMGLQAELYPRIVSIVRELVGGGVMQLPSTSAELLNPETREDLARYVQSPGVPTEDRVKLFKLAWDCIGSEFAGRSTQYEMFYAGAPFVSRTNAYRNYGYEEATEEVMSFLNSYGLEDS